MDVRARKAEPEVGGRVLGSQRLTVLRILKGFGRFGDFAGSKSHCLAGILPRNWSLDELEVVVVPDSDEEIVEPCPSSCTGGASRDGTRARQASAALSGG